MKNILIFPKRGNPPPDQPPYIREPGDPFVFRLPLVQCRHRTKQSDCGGCNGSGGPDWCDHYEKFVDRAICFTCTKEGKNEIQSG